MDAELRCELKRQVACGAIASRVVLPDSTQTTAKEWLGQNPERTPSSLWQACRAGNLSTEVEVSEGTWVCFLSVLDTVREWWASQSFVLQCNVLDGLFVELSVHMPRTTVGDLCDAVLVASDGLFDGGPLGEDDSSHDNVAEWPFLLYDGDGQLINGNGSVCAHYWKQLGWQQFARYVADGSMPYLRAVLADEDTAPLVQRSRETHRRHFLRREQDDAYETVRVQTIEHEKPEQTEQQEQAEQPEKAEQQEQAEPGDIDRPLTTEELRLARLRYFK